MDKKLTEKTKTEALTKQTDFEYIIDFAVLFCLALPELCKLKMTSLLPLALVLCLATAEAESSAVPYPAPQFPWHHAWPYDSTTGVAVSTSIKVSLHSSPSTAPTVVASADAASSDPLVATILGRYQTLLRSKASATQRGAGIAAMPVLAVVRAVITGGFAWNRD